MGKRVLKAELSVKSIENLKKELLDYKNNELNRLLVKFTEELFKIGIQVVDERMNNASYKFDKDNIMSGADPSHNTFVRISKFGSNVKATLVVTGRELLFIEFGAGIHYNTPVGTSPNDYGVELGYTIGSYGHHHGLEEMWTYKDENGIDVVSYGTEATMPLWKAEVAIKQQFISIAKSVFGS